MMRYRQWFLPQFSAVGRNGGQSFADRSFSNAPAHSTSPKGTGASLQLWSNGKRDFLAKAILAESISQLRSTLLVPSHRRTKERRLPNLLAHGAENGFVPNKNLRNGLYS
jgi:hypothetical protein